MSPSRVLISLLTISAAALGMRGSSKPITDGAQPSSSRPSPVALEDVEIAWLTARSERDLLPVPVRARLDAFLAAHRSWRWNDELLRLDVPRSEGRALQLFVGRLPRKPTGHELRFLFLYDPTTGATTAEPVVFDGNWLGEEGVHPRLADLDRDGCFELVYRDFRHNGTVVNVEMTVFLMIGDDLALDEVLRYDSWCSDIESRGEFGVVRKRLLRTDEGVLVLETSRSNPRFGAPVELLDSVHLQHDTETGAWCE